MLKKLLKISSLLLWTALLSMALAVSSCDDDHSNDGVDDDDDIEVDIPVRWAGLNWTEGGYINDFLVLAFTKGLGADPNTYYFDYVAYIDDINPHIGEEVADITVLIKRRAKNQKLVVFANLGICGIKATPVYGETMAATLQKYKYSKTPSTDWWSGGIIQTVDQPIPMYAESDPLDLSKIQYNQKYEIGTLLANQADNKFGHLEKGSSSSKYRLHLVRMVSKIDIYVLNDATKIDPTFKFEENIQMSYMYKGGYVAYLTENMCTDYLTLPVNNPRGGYIKKPWIPTGTGYFFDKYKWKVGNGTLQYNGNQTFNYSRKIEKEIYVFESLDGAEATKIKIGGNFPNEALAYDSLFLKNNFNDGVLTGNPPTGYITRNSHYLVFIKELEKKGYDVTFTISVEYVDEPQITVPIDPQHKFTVYSDYINDPTNYDNTNTYLNVDGLSELKFKIDTEFNCSITTSGIVTSVSPASVTAGTGRDVTIGFNNTINTGSLEFVVNDGSLDRLKYTFHFQKTK
ncbi:hypothetical protein [Bacteroides sp. 519]|uniref:hypothetical protein n=1 Tax=Bacteroides sp. 519 TaxID=2302937 RepID=UPI0013D642F8|nr:hypothetical protein [Bacteroides sp. 519]NDV59495.1 hypothetical protein [Bacteroides sp. 519]